MTGFITWLWRPQKELSGWGRAIRSPFSIMAFFYGRIIKARQRLFDTGFFKKKKLSVPVLVVGNLNAGGTGKTPLAAWLARRFLEKGIRPALICRGYRGRAEGDVLVVQDGREIQGSVEDAGEEPVWLSENLPGLPVVIGKDRYQAGIRAQERFGVDPLILDDGFQHLALQRDVDVVLLDAMIPLEQDALLPRGRLREPPSALSRAQVIVMAHARSEAPEQAGYLRRWNSEAPVFFMRYIPQNRLPSGKSALAFCGIGSPGYFFELCEDQGVRLVDKVVFPDHHDYKKAELKRLEKRAQDMNAEFLLTTEKDEIKIRGKLEFSLPLLVLKVEPDFFGKDDEFFNLVLKLLYS
jgi:tetraacyldisaccharide 4'-kinase